MNTLLAAAEEPTRGWGGPVALAIAVAAFGAIAWTTQWARDKIANRSPTPPRGRGVAVSPQVRPVSDTGDTDDADEVYEWGRIGRAARMARQIVRTGSTDGWDDDVADDDDEGPEEVDDEEEKPEQAAARLLAEEVPYMGIVRHLMAAHGMGDSTARRLIRDVRAGAGVR